MHSTSLLGLLKNFWGQNLQNFIPLALPYAFGRRPNFFKWELWLRPNVKNTASVIHWWQCRKFDKSDRPGVKSFWVGSIWPSRSSLYRVSVLGLSAKIWLGVNLDPMSNRADITVVDNFRFFMPHWKNFTYLPQGGREFLWCLSLLNVEIFYFCQDKDIKIEKFLKILKFGWAPEQTDYFGFFFYLGEKILYRSAFLNLGEKELCDVIKQRELKRWHQFSEQKLKKISKVKIFKKSFLLHIGKSELW